MYLASLRRSWQFFSCRSFQTNLKSISDSRKEWPRITKAPFSSIAIVSRTSSIRNCLLLADGQSCPKPQPFSTKSQPDPLPSKKTRRWYKRLEIVLPALIALGIALRVLLDEFSDGDKSQEKLKTSQRISIFASLDSIILLITLTFFGSLVTTRNVNSLQNRIRKITLRLRTRLQHPKMQWCRQLATHNKNATKRPLSLHSRRRRWPTTSKTASRKAVGR